MDHMNYWCDLQGTLVESYKGGKDFSEMKGDMVVEPVLCLHKQEAINVKNIYIREKLVSGRSSSRERWTVIQAH